MPYIMSQSLVKVRASQSTQRMTDPRGQISILLGYMEMERRPQEKHSRLGLLGEVDILMILTE